MLAVLRSLNMCKTSASQTIPILVSMAGGHYTFGKPEHYDKFMDKYLTWLESLMKHLESIQQAQVIEWSRWAYKLVNTQCLICCIARSMA